MEGTEVTSWSQLEGETDRDYSRFRKWLTLNDRRLHRACVHLGLGESRCRKLSAQWDWIKRAAAYDLHEAEQVQAESARARLRAANALALAVAGTAESRLDVPDEDRDAQELQRLTAALKNLMPNTEVSIDTNKGNSDENEVMLTIRRARELSAEDPEV